MLIFDYLANEQCDDYTESLSDESVAVATDDDRHSALHGASGTSGARQMQTDNQPNTSQLHGKLCCVTSLFSHVHAIDSTNQQQLLYRRG